MSNHLYDIRWTCLNKVSNMSNMFESLVVVEPPLLKVPIEALKKAIRTSQKYIEKEVLSFPVLLAALSNQDQFKRIETLKAVKRRIENLVRKVNCFLFLFFHFQVERNKRTGSFIYHKNKGKNCSLECSFKDWFIGKRWVCYMVPKKTWSNHGRLFAKKWSRKYCCCSSQRCIFNNSLFGLFIQLDWYRITGWFWVIHWC